MNNAGTCFNIATTCQIDTAYLHCISYHDMSCLFASEMLQSEDCLFYFYLNLVCCFVCEVQSSDIVSSVCQTVNIDCAIND